MGSSSDTAEGNSRTKGAALLPRVLVGLAGIPLLALAAIRGGYVLLVLVDLLIMLGLWEFYRLLAAKGLRPHRMAGIAGGLLLSWQIFFAWGPGVRALLTIVLLVVMVGAVVRRDTRGAVADMAGTLLGVLYVGLLSSYFFLLRDLPDRMGGRPQDGGWILLAVFIITWVYDTGAYGVGLLWGKHPLMPRISPKKSIEGAVGGLLWGLLAALLLSRLFFPGLLSLGNFLVIALIAGIIGPLGDLAESLIKRDAGVKDTSNILPGHGGVLDRFDSLLFIVPAVYWYLRYLVY
jgi:phosphatidate cytidylyltransferase